MNELLMNSMFPGFAMNSIGMSPQVDPGLQVGQEKAFLDVLDLVSELEVVDSQAENEIPFLNESSDEILSQRRVETLGANPLIGLEALAAQDMTANKVTQVGQESIKNNIASETSVKAPLSNLMDAQIGSMAAARPLQNTAIPDLKSAAVWAAALQTGDLKSVQALPKPDVAAQFTQDTLRQNEVGKAAVFPKQMEAKSAELSQLAAAPLASAPEILASKSLARKLPAAEKAELVEPKSTFTRLEFPRVEMKSESDSTENHLMGSGKKTFFKSQSSKPQQASDFFLNRMTASASPTDVKSESFSSPFIDVSQVGNVGDKRVSSEALNFVGQKVQDLKALGGGEIKVDLHPKDLGSLEIRVGMKSGKMEVVISAEKPETLQALQQSSSELKGNLDQIATTDLRVVNKTHVEPRLDSQGPRVAQTSVAASSKNVESTQDMMSLRASHSHRNTLRESAPEILSSAKMSPSLGDMSVDSIVESREPSPNEMSVSLSRDSEAMGGDLSSEHHGDAWKKWEEYQKRKSA